MSVVARNVGHMNGASGNQQQGAAVGGVAAGVLLGSSTVPDLRSWKSALGVLERDVSDEERIDQLRALEELKAAACAAQARVAADLDASRRAEQAMAGVPAERRGRGVGAQVALARRESPNRGGRLLGLAKALVAEMPHTYRALRQGLISEWRATLLVRESACLTVADRAAFDAELVSDPATLEGMGDRQLVGRAREVAYRLDGASVVRRARRAEGERRVSLRPAPDTMSYLTGLLPVAQGVGVFAALTAAADAARAQGDARSRGQVMADTLVERVTGQASAGAVPVEVQLVMTERVLLGGDDEPATIPGYGTVPAGWARGLVADLLRACALQADDDAGATDDNDDRAQHDDDAAAADDLGPDDAAAAAAAGGRGRVALWLRRLFTAPSTGQLVALDSRRRVAPSGLARFIDVRDQTCRTPWCDAPIRHRDHIVPHADGGATSAHNLQGYCEACNYAKQAPGWCARTLADAAARAGRTDPGTTGTGATDAGHVVETTTPTGHRYRSRAPALPGHGRHQRAGPIVSGRDDSGDSGVERYMMDLLYSAA